MGFEGDARALWSALDSDNSGITGFEEVSPKNAFSWRNMHVLKRMQKEYILKRTQKTE